MPLSCSCEFGGDYEWYYVSPDDYCTFGGKRRKRCSSCRELINFGEQVAVFECWRPPGTEVEVRIYGEDGEVPIADKILCEECTDIYFSLAELGFNCVGPTENMRMLAREHKALTAQ